MTRSQKIPMWRRFRRHAGEDGGSAPDRTDAVFAVLRAVPPAGADRPRVIEDGPPAGYHWPIRGQEVLEAVRTLPRRDQRGITHLWLRSPSPSADVTTLPLATFICGGGVRLITLYPWRSDRRIELGLTRPKRPWVERTARFGARTYADAGRWFTEFDELGLRRFYVEHLLYHEVGHHVDWYTRQWTDTNVDECERAADEYAASFSKTATFVVDRMTRRRTGECPRNPSP
jgi:hypothetical protein